MPEKVNVSSLTYQNEQSHHVDNRETMIKIDHVDMVFNMASEQLNNLKEYAIKIVRRELFFEGFTALEDITFEVKRGDVYGIVGTNGSGKSTLLKIIAGVLDPTKGSCQINGNIAPLIELGAGFDSELSARENIYLNGALLGYSKDFINEHFDDIVEFAEVSKFLDMPLKNYSSGMVARIAFAIATIIIPDILIVDEVLSVGDFMFQKKCENRINELIEKHGVTILIVSHSNEQVARICNKAIWIEKGHTRMIGDAADVCRVYGALGGRTGSAESEQYVFDMLKENPRDEDAEDLPCVYGEDTYSTAALFIEKAWRSKPQDSVALVCGITHINAILANGFAGACNIPVLPTKHDSIPTEIYEALNQMKPNTIYLFDRDYATESIVKKLKTLPGNPELVPFTLSHDMFKLSLEVYRSGREQGSWGDIAIIVDFADNSEALALSLFAYRQKCPVFIVDGSTSESRKALSEELRVDGFSTLIIAGATANRSVVADFEACNSFKIECFDSENSYENCLNECTWSFAQYTELEPKELLVASNALGQWPDLLGCANYASNCNCTLLLEDPTNLDSIAACMRFVSKNRDAISRITFIGSEMGLSNTDKETLYSVYKGKR